MKLSDISAAMDNLLDALNERINTLCEQVGIEPDDPILSDEDEGEDNEDGEGEGAEGEENGGEENATPDANAEGDADGAATDGAETAAGTEGAEETEESVEPSNEGTIGSVVGGALGAIAGGAVGQPTLGAVAGSAIGHKLTEDETTNEDTATQSNDTGAEGVAIQEMEVDPNQAPDSTQTATAAPIEEGDTNADVLAQMDSDDNLREISAKTEGCCAEKKTKAKDFSDFKKWTSTKKGGKKAIKEAAEKKFVIKGANGYFKAGGSPTEDPFFTDDKGEAATYASEDDAKKIVNAISEEGGKFTIEAV